MVLRPFLEHYLWRFATVRVSVAWRKPPSLFTVEQVPKLLLVRRKKMQQLHFRRIFFSFSPKIFFKKSLKLRWPQKMFMNNSVVEGEEKAELKRAATVCRLCKNFWAPPRLCSLPTPLVSFPRLLQIGFGGRLLYPLHHRRTLLCQIQTGLKKNKKTIVMRCLCFSYRIILPSDSLTLKQMSYNVKSAKSVLFCHSRKREIFGISCAALITLNSEVTPSCDTLAMLRLTVTLMFCFPFMSTFCLAFFSLFFCWGHCMHPAPRMPLIDT